MKKKKNLEFYLSLPYKTETYFVPDDNTWVACHPELGRGSCYAIGETEDEAREFLKDEKKFLLEFALKEKKEIPEPKLEEDILPSGQFVVRLPRTLHKKLKNEADKENVSLNLYVTNALAEHVGQRQS